MSKGIVYNLVFQRETTTLDNIYSLLIIRILRIHPEEVGGCVP
jgi:hypothetical protein